MRPRLQFVRACLLLLIGLVAIASPALKAQTQVLVIYADGVSGGTDVQAKLIGTGLLPGGIVLYDAATNIAPTLAYLQQFSSVFVYSNNTFNNPTGYGNVLADYVDAGGGVVQAVFSLHSSWSLSGRWETSNYNPVTLGTYGTSNLTLGTVLIPSSPIMTGVTALNGGSGGYNATGLNLRSGASLVAQWSDGTPLVVVNPNLTGRIVALNLFPPSSTVQSGSWLTTTDGARLMANAINFVSIPEPSTYALLGIGGVMLFLRARRKMFRRS